MTVRMTATTAAARARAGVVAGQVAVQVGVVIFGRGRRGGGRVGRRQRLVVLVGRARVKVFVVLVLAQQIRTALGRLRYDSFGFRAARSSTRTGLRRIFRVVLVRTSRRRGGRGNGRVTGHGRRRQCVVVVIRRAGHAAAARTVVVRFFTERILRSEDFILTGGPLGRRADRRRGRRAVQVRIARRWHDTATSDVVQLGAMFNVRRRVAFFQRYAVVVGGRARVGIVGAVVGRIDPVAFRRCVVGGRCVVHHCVRVPVGRVGVGGRVFVRVQVGSEIVVVVVVVVVVAAIITETI